MQQDIAIRCQEFREEFGQDLVANIIELYIPDARRRLEALRQALVMHNAPQLMREAHGLKGSCQNVGANQLGDLCLEIEKLGGTGDLAAAERVLARLETEFRRTLPYLEAERNRN